VAPAAVKRFNSSLLLNGLTAGCEGGDKTERLLDFGLERELAREGSYLERAEQAPLLW
jgi:hypothetical protein